MNLLKDLGDCLRPQFSNLNTEKRKKLISLVRGKVMVELGITEDTILDFILPTIPDKDLIAYLPLKEQKEFTDVLI